MGWFSRSKPEVRRPHVGVRHDGTPTGGATGPAAPRAVIRRPAPDETGPAAALLTLASDSGLTLVWSARLSVQALLEQVLTVAPRLRASSTVGAGFMQPAPESGIFWTLLDVDDQAAFVAVCSSDADTRFMTEAIMMPLGDSQTEFELVHLGEASAPTVALFHNGVVVPPWEVPGFTPFGKPSQWSTLPITVRRAVAGWSAIADDVFTRSLVDIDGDEVTINVGLFDGRPVIAYPFRTQDHDDLSAFAWVAEHGYDITWADPTVMVLSHLDPARVSAPGVVDQAQQLVDNIARGLAAMNAPLPLPPPPSGELCGHWEVVESTPDGRIPALAIGPELARADALMVERVRDVSGDGRRTFLAVEEASNQLRARRGTGFEYAVRRVDDDGLLTPDHLTVVSVAVDPRTGRVVLAGHPSHTTFGLSPGYDGGMTDGRNALTFREGGYEQGLCWPPTYLYVGSARTGCLLPLSYGDKVTAVAYDPGSGVVASLEFLGASAGALARWTPDGQRHVITIVDPVSGNEQLSFSPDGSWLAVSRYDGTRLVEVSSGRHLVLDLPHATWWPLEPSTMIGVRTVQGRTSASLYSLAEANVTGTFPELRISEQIPELPHLHGLSVSADGQTLYALGPVGVSAAFLHEHGTGQRVVRIDLGTGFGAPVHGVFLDAEHTFEREVAQVSVAATRPPGSVILHEDLLARLADPIREHEYLYWTRWSDEAGQFVDKLLATAVAGYEQDRDPGDVMPDLLAAMAAFCRDPENWGRLRDWATDVAQGSTRAIRDGRLTGSAATSWTTFASAVAALEIGRPDLISPLQAAWRGEGTT